MTSEIESTIDKLILLIVGGMGEADLRTACTANFGLDPADVDQAIETAKQKLTKAASYDRDEALGKAITRVEDIYTRAIRAKDIRTALTAQRELNKLLALYAEEGTAASDADAPQAAPSTADAEELAAIAEHLLPLDLAPESYPLREHARIAADHIREHAATRRSL